MKANKANKVNKVKKSSKILLVGIIILILGTVFFIIGMSVLKWDFLNLDTTVYTQHVVGQNELGLKENEKITKVNIDMTGWNVKVVHGEEFNVQYYTTEESLKDEVKINYENGAVNFVQKSTPIINFKMFNGIKKWKYISVFTVPSMIDLTVVSGNLNLNIENLSIKNLDINSNNASVDLSNVNAENIKIESDNSSVELDTVMTGSVNIISDNAAVDIKKSFINKVDLNGNNSTFNCLESKIGNYFENSEVYGGITVNGGNMSFYAKDSSLEIIDVETSNASIKLDSCTVINFIGKGNNSSFKTENCTFISVEFTSNNGYVNMNGTKECNYYKFMLDNGSVIVNILGAKEDFKTIKADGKDMTFRINGQKVDNDTYTNASGTKEFLFSGNNANVKINF